MFIQSLMVGSERHSIYIRASGLEVVKKSHFKLNRAFSFRVIQSHPYRCRQKSKMGCCHNVHFTIMSTLFLKLTKIQQW